MVYEALKRLHGRGAALETVEERATLYRPMPPELLLGRYESEHQRLLQQLRRGLGELYAHTPDNRLWSLKGRSTTLTYATQLIQNAQTELFLVLTDEDLAELHSEITTAHNQGVMINALLTGTTPFSAGRVAYHPPLESQLQGLQTTLLVEADDKELLIASKGTQGEMLATITGNHDLVHIARQFVWMELFTQRIYARLGPELLMRLDAEDRQIFESLDTTNGAT